jgi:hypothetical protein
MRPLETHVEMSCHLWVLNRVKELLAREGMLTEPASPEEVKAAVMVWLDFIEKSHHPGAVEKDCGAALH